MSAAPTGVRPPLLSLVVFFLIFLVRTVLRRDWLAAAAAIVLVTALAVGRSPNLFSLIAAGFLVAFAMLVLFRFGVLPLVVAAFVHVSLLVFPVISDVSAWYSGASLIALGTILTLAVWSFRAALGGRQLWKSD